jgi:hypothetical protein
MLTAEKLHFEAGLKKNMLLSSYQCTVKIFFALEGCMPKEI